MEFYGNKSFKSVSILWDMETSVNSATSQNVSPPSSLNGFGIVERIRAAVQHFGPILSFRAYCEANSTSQKKITLRSELQSSAVSLIDCPHNGAKDVVDKMIIVDAVFASVDQPTSAIVVITGDRDYAYLVASLRQRLHMIIVVAPKCASFSLKANASHFIPWEAITMVHEEDENTLLNTSENNASSSPHLLESADYGVIDLAFPPLNPSNAVDANTSRRGSHEGLSPVETGAEIHGTVEYVPDLGDGDIRGSPDQSSAMAFSPSPSAPNVNPSPASASLSLPPPHNALSSAAHGVAESQEFLLKTTPNSGSPRVDSESQLVAEPAVPVDPPPVPVPTFASTAAANLHLVTPGLGPFTPITASNGPLALGQAIQASPVLSLSQTELKSSIPMQSFLPLVKIIGSRRDSNSKRTPNAVAQQLITESPNIYIETKTFSWKCYSGIALERGVMEYTRSGQQLKPGPNAWQVAPKLFIPILRIMRDSGKAIHHRSFVYDSIAKQDPHFLKKHSYSNWKAYGQDAETQGIVKLSLIGSTAMMTLDEPWAEICQLVNTTSST